ncbi:MULTISPECIES: GAF and ANTAR domain-containing protein [Streptomyces]|uniref:ANTAR domain-containing protein n=1 Tax=Streptomyces cadmiisoli TaxID=2184053 RepID=A0A2Z4J216_9ACTN|nr:MULTISPECIES: GAF and ANTAR domain-containing protein [Streptomyces]AWW38728.1 ANTAR domain-containing protein [Streptomyces cadmiisoli]KOV65682.1 antitermination regulator [Streptomyces sp. AS58]
MRPETPETLDKAMSRSTGLDTLLRDLTDRAVEAVPGVAACSVTVRRAERLLTLAGSRGLPSGLDQRQYENGSGPCVEAADTGVEQYAADLVTEDRWPEYRSYALSVGVRSVLALPLRTTGGRSGAALNFYGTGPGALGGSRDAAREFASRARDAIDIALRIEHERTSAGDVRTALLSRSVIDQAIGILMAQERVDAHAALARLRRVSQKRNVKLRDLCTELVAGVARGGGSAGRRQ